MFYSLWPHGMQRARLLCSLLYQGLLKFLSIESVMPSNQLISAAPFSFSLQSFPASGSFPVSWLESGAQSTGASASASVLLMNIQGWFPFRIDWFDLLAVQRTFKSLLQNHNSKESILWPSAYVMVQLSHSYMTTEKNHSFDFMDLCWQRDVSALQMSLFFGFLFVSLFL